MNYLPEVLPEYRQDFSNELSIDSFKKYGFYKIAEAVLKEESRFIKIQRLIQFTIKLKKD